MNNGQGQREHTTIIIVRSKVTFKTEWIFLPIRYTLQAFANIINEIHDALKCINIYNIWIIFLLNRLYKCQLSWASSSSHNLHRNQDDDEWRNFRVSESTLPAKRNVRKSWNKKMPYSRRSFALIWTTDCEEIYLIK